MKNVFVRLCLKDGRHLNSEVMWAPQSQPQEQVLEMACLALEIDQKQVDKWGFIAGDNAMVHTAQLAFTILFDNNLEVFIK